MKKRGQTIRDAMASGYRVSMMRRKQPVEWAPGEQRELIDQAIADGRRMLLPAAFAHGAYGQNFTPLSNALGGWHRVARRGAQ